MRDKYTIVILALALAISITANYTRCGTAEKSTIQCAKEKPDG